MEYEKYIVDLKADYTKRQELSDAWKLEVYNTHTDTWAEKAEMPRTCSGMAATVFRDKIYLIGGVENIQGPAVKTVAEYDPKTDTWTQKAEMPTPRTALAVSQGGAKIYAIGGTDVVQGPGLMTVEIYDPITDTWEKGTEMPTARVFLGAGTVDNEIYAIGGVAQGLGPNILPTVEALPLKSLSIAASNKKQTVWGDLKRQD